MLALNQTCEGYFLCEASGGERGTVQFPIVRNQILDIGITTLLNTTTNILQYIGVGTGNSTPDPSQSTLDNMIAITNRNSTTTHSYHAAMGDTPAYGQTAFSVQFDRGQAAGNLSEVCVGWTANGAQNWSRALFRDSNGDPTTITIRSDEFFRVTYICRRYVPPVWTGIMAYDDDGVMKETTVTINPGSSTTSGSGLGSAGLIRYATTTGGNTFSWIAAQPAPNQKQWRVSYSLEQGNPSISSITMTSMSGLASVSHIIPSGTTITFDPPITKTNEFEVSIDFVLTITPRVP